MIRLGQLKIGSMARVAYVFQRGTADALRALLAFPLVLLLLLVLLQYGGQVLQDIGRQGVQSMYIRAAALAVAVGLLFCVVVKRKVAWHPRAFLPCSLGVAAIVYYAYVTSIEVVWVSDFQGMWQTAVDLVASDDYTVESIHDQRALPVLVPAILLFGPDPAIVPLINLVFLLGIQVFGYDLARRIAGHRAAQGATVLWVAAMEPILALPITSHDIWGLFFLACFLWGFRATLDRLAAGRDPSMSGRLVFVACVLALAWVLTLLNMQRSIAPLVILGFILGGLLLALKGKGSRPALRPAVQLALTVFLLYLGFTAGLKHGHYMLTAEQRTVYTQIRVGAYSSSLSNGTYRQGQVLNDEFFDQLEDEARKDLIRAIPLSDMALQPIARFGNVIYRGPAQAKLGSQNFFYQAQAKARSAWLIPFTRAYNICYSILIAALSLWLILPLLRRLESIDVLLQLALLSALVGSLLFVGESQPRYVFPIWFILPQLVAFAWVLHPELVRERLAVSSVWGWDVTRGAAWLVAAYLVLALSLRWMYGESQGRILSGWQPALHGVTGQPPPDWFAASQNLSALEIRQQSMDRRVTGFGDLSVVMQIPTDTQAGGGVSAQKVLCTGSGRRTLDFFYYMPRGDVQVADAFTLEVLVDGKKRWSSPLRGGTPLPETPYISHADIPDILPPDTCGTLEFNLRANQETSPSSSTSAPRADVYFARLIE